MTQPALSKRRLTYLAGVAIYCIIGFASAFLLSRERSGYLASFGFIMIVFALGGLIFLLCIVGAIFLLLAELRWLSALLLLSILLIPASYLITLKTLSYLGLVRYEHERMTPIESGLPQNSMGDWGSSNSNFRKT